MNILERLIRQLLLLDQKCLDKCHEGRKCQSCLINQQINILLDKLTEEEDFLVNEGRTNVVDLKLYREAKQIVFSTGLMAPVYHSSLDCPRLRNVIYCISISLQDLRVYNSKVRPCKNCLNA